MPRIPVLLWLFLLPGCAAQSNASRRGAPSAVAQSPHPIRAPEAWLDAALQQNGYSAEWRQEVAFSALPEVPLQVEPQRCYVIAAIVTDAPRFPEALSARWGPERGNTARDAVYDSNYKTRIFELGCTLTPRKLSVVLSSGSLPAGRGVVKLYTQSISAAEYDAALDKAGADKKYFAELAAKRERQAALDAERRGRMTCQDCVNSYGQCLRTSSYSGDFARRTCSGEFDSCVGNSEVIRKNTCLVAR